MMNPQGGYFRPPQLPPRIQSGGGPPPSLPPQQPSYGSGPPPLPLSSKPTITQPTPPPAPRNTLDDPEVISNCPENDVLHATAYWYTTPEIPGVEICSHCFATHIRDTQWASRFHRQLEHSDADRRCRFSTQRMLQLWPQVVRNNDWSYISGYMARRAKIADCKGPTPLKADVGTQWYTLRDNDIETFGACAACYEDMILATPFANFFQPTPGGQPAGELWNCKMTKYAQRAMEQFGPTNNWRQFVASVGYSMKVPKCDGAAGTMAYQRMWYRPKPYIDGLVVCEACFFEYVAASFMESQWEAIQVPSVLDGGWKNWVCDMSLLPMKVAYLKSMRTKDFGIFWNAAKEIIASPTCAADGVTGGTWYRLGQGGEFIVCPQCFAGIIKSWGYGGHFVQVQLPPNEIFLCDFNASTPRQMQYLYKIDEAISVRNFSIFTDYAIRFGSIPLCSTYNPVSNRRWYGNDDFTACESCWEEFVKETSLAPRLRQGFILPQAYCDFYSARMRRLWLEACAKGDMTDFTAFAKQRTAVYGQTVPRMLEILAVMKMRMATKQTLFMSSIMLQGADNIVGASRPAWDHTSYGNAQVGYNHATYSGAQGAMQFNQALGMNIMGGDEMMQVSQLESIWKQVE